MDTQAHTQLFSLTSLLSALLEVQWSSRKQASGIMEAGLYRPCIVPLTQPCLKKSTRKKRYRQNNYSVLNSRLNRSRSRASQASQRSSVRPSKATVILIVVQMLSDMIAFCPASGPRLFRCKLSAVTKCSIASLQVTEHYNACQQQRTQHHIHSVTTNLEYSGISLNTENS